MMVNKLLEFLNSHPKERCHLEDLEVNGRIILKWI
jgi:hypothetical protein